MHCFGVLLVNFEQVNTGIYCSNIFNFSNKNTILMFFEQVHFIIAQINLQFLIIFFANMFFSDIY